MDCSAPRKALRDRQPHALHTGRKSLSQQLDCSAGRTPVGAAGNHLENTNLSPKRLSKTWAVMAYAKTCLPCRSCRGKWCTPASPTFQPHGSSVRSRSIRRALCQHTSLLQQPLPPLAPAGFSMRNPDVVCTTLAATRCCLTAQEALPGHLPAAGCGEALCTADKTLG